MQPVVIITLVVLMENLGIVAQVFRSGTQSLAFFSGEDDILTWADAAAACVSKGGRLATPDHPLDVYGYINDNYPSTWVWTDGKEVDSNFPWGPTEPNGRNEHCMAVGVGGWYMDVPCSHPKRAYICEAAIIQTVGCPGVNGLFQENNGNCYHFSSDASTGQTASWEKARKKCQEHGNHIHGHVGLAELGDPNNMESDNWLMRTITEKGIPFWLGAHDPKRDVYSKNNWIWAFSQRSLSSGDGFWRHGAPSIQGFEWCLVTWKSNNNNTKIYDGNCNDNHHYVCQFFKKG